MQARGRKEYFMNLRRILHHSARLYRNKVALTFQSSQITYGQMEENCLKLGSVFCGLGLKQGDRIGVLDFNSMALATALFGIPACGMVVLPLNHRLATQELIEILQDAEVSALIYSPSFSETVEKMRTQLRSGAHFICTEEDGDGRDLPTLMKNAPAAHFNEPDPSDLATLLYTSGTTGKPKGVQLSHRNTVSTLASLLVELELTAHDSGLMVAPLFHVAGCHTFMALIARGCTAHLLPGFEPKNTLETLVSTKSTITILVPAMISAILNLEEQKNVDISSLRLLLYAGAPMPEQLLRTAISRFGLIFFQIYGLTETSVLTCLSPMDHTKPGLHSSAGREMYGCEVMVVNADGSETVPGKIGQIVARGDNVTSGYWRALEETETSLKNGWFYTGDVGFRDESAYLFLKDRIKDMIVTGGENVYPVELENVLHEIPEVDEAAVIGIPDDRWGEQVIALVHLAPNGNISEEEVISFCRERMAGYKCPRTVEFKGPLPRTPSGKIRKNILREPYWEGFDRKVH